MNHLAIDAYINEYAIGIPRCSWPGHAAIDRAVELAEQKGYERGIREAEEEWKREQQAEEDSYPDDQRFPPDR